MLIKHSTTVQCNTHLEMYIIIWSSHRSKDILKRLILLKLGLKVACSYTQIVQRKFRNVQPKRKKCAVNYFCLKQSHRLSYSCYIHSLDHEIIGNYIYVYTNMPPLCAVHPHVLQFCIGCQKKTEEKDKHQRRQNRSGLVLFHGTEEHHTDRQCS